MTDIEELLERLYKETKITYEEYSAIKARLGHLTLVIESYKQADVEAEEIIAELKAHCKVVDEVNEKMKCCGNCRYQRYDYESRYCEYDATSEKECINKSEWELVE